MGAIGLGETHEHPTRSIRRAGSITVMREMMVRTGRLCATVLIVALSLALTGCDRSTELNGWPSFSEAVQQAAVAVQAKARAKSAYTNGLTRPEPVPIDPTREAILSALRASDRRDLYERLGTLDARAIDPMLEILADGSVRPVYRDLVASNLIRIVTRPDPFRHAGIGGYPPIELRPVTPEVGRVTDAVLAYCRAVPPKYGSMISGLTEIAPIDRLPAILEVAETSSDERTQAAAIGLFSTLTHTQFPTIPIGFCGNSSRESRDRAMAEGRVRQRESLVKMRQWWNEHGKEPYSAWAIAGVRRLISDHKRFLLEAYPPDCQEDCDPDGRTWQIRGDWQSEYTRFGPSVFDTLVEAFREEPDFVKPFVLGLIAMTRHPDARAFVAKQLDSPDANVRFVAVVQWRAVGDAKHLEDVQRVIDTAGDDKPLCEEATKTLEALKLEAELEKAVDAVAASDGDAAATNAAMALIRPYVPTHRRRLRQVADTYPDSAVGRAIRRVLDQVMLEAVAPPDYDRQARLAAVRSKLRSGDWKSLQSAAAIVGNEELVEFVPEVVPLLAHRYCDVSEAAANTLMKLGIPGLTVENAPRLMGNSFALDRQIAAYCYDRFGRAALPLVERAAFEWRDPCRRGTQVGEPAPGLLRVLLDEKVPGVTRRIRQLALEHRTRRQYMGLLALIDGPETTRVVEDLLTNRDPRVQQSAVDLAGHLKLASCADRLVELADDADVQAMEAAAQNCHGDSYSNVECRRRREQYGWAVNRPFRAVMALIELGDPRAWPALVQLMQTHYLDWRRQNPILGRNTTRLAFRLADHKSVYHDAMREALHKELEGAHRYWIVETLTVALSRNPDAADADMLWEVVAHAESGEDVRVLALVALSKLGDPRALPVLRDTVRTALRKSVETGESGLPYFGVWPHSEPKPRVFASPLLDRRSPLDWVWLRLEEHHVDPAMALARYGDESLVDNALDSLVTVRGALNQYAYVVLNRLVGAKSLELARARLAPSDADLLFELENVAVATDPEANLAQALLLLDRSDLTFYAVRNVLVAKRYAPAGDQLVALYQRRAAEPEYAWRNSQIIDVLCQIGDPRGLALVSDDIELFADTACYLPGGPAVWPAKGSFKYNRVEQAQALRSWYRAHADELEFDRDRGVFVLADDG